MNPEDIEKMCDFIRLKRAFKIGSRGCSLRAQYFNNEWILYIERAELTMAVDILRLSYNADKYYLVGFKRDVTCVFRLELEEYIKFTDMSFIRTVKE